MNFILHIMHVYNTDNGSLKILLRGVTVYYDMHFVCLMIVHKKVLYLGKKI